MGGGRNWIRVGAEVAVPWTAVEMDATAVQFTLPVARRDEWGERAQGGHVKFRRWLAGRRLHASLYMVNA